MWKGILWVSLTAVLLTTGSVPLVSAAPSRTGESNSQSNALASTNLFMTNPSARVSTLCSTSPDLPGGIYKGKGGAFVEDWSNGNLLWCSGGIAKVIGTAPPGGRSSGYYGMAGISTSTGLVLVLDTFGARGLWFCDGASSSGCIAQSALITLPSSFCTAQVYGYCNPDGIVLDNQLNVYYADSLNDDVVECTASSEYQTCEVLETLTPQFTVETSNLFIDPSGNIWVTDSSNYGYIWENGALKYTIGQTVTAITMSKANPEKTLQLYIAVDCIHIHTCTPTHILDLTDGDSIPTKLKGASDIVGLSSSLQFTDGYSQAVYSTKDKV